MANGLFDNLGGNLEKFFLGDEPRIAREQKMEAANLEIKKQGLAEKRFSQQEVDRLFELVKSPNLTPQAREVIGQKLSQHPQFADISAQIRQARVIQAKQEAQGVMPKLFDALQTGKLRLSDAPGTLRGIGQKLQGSIDAPVNLFKYVNSPKVRPTEQTPVQKDFDKDIRILNDTHLSGPNKGAIKANQTQLDAAKDRLRQSGQLREVPADTDVDFSEALKGSKKVKVKGAKFDKAFGEEAYNEMLKQVEEDALADGVTEESAVASFNAWWDRKAQEEDPGGFGAFIIPRSEFKSATIQTDIDKSRDNDITALSNEELRKIVEGGK
jgi:hypothetical protein